MLGVVALAIVGCLIGYMSHKMSVLRSFVVLHDYGGLQPRSTSVSFDSVEWRQHPAVTDPSLTRWGMVKDLLASKVLIGLLEEEVEKLLGRPDSYARPFPDASLMYVLKPTMSEHTWLAIYCDSRGRVTSAVLRDG